jgi:hypothetical protein
MIIEIAAIWCENLMLDVCIAAESVSGLPWYVSTPYFDSIRYQKTSYGNVEKTLKIGFSIGIDHN